MLSANISSPELRSLTLALNFDLRIELGHFGWIADAL
jgi:hypothetical protein